MNKKVLFFFSLSWCESSQQMFRVIKDIEQSKKFENIKFVFCDVDTQNGADNSCKYSVKNVPTILLLNGDKEVRRIKGKVNSETIKSILKKWK